MTGLATERAGRVLRLPDVATYAELVALRAQEAPERTACVVRDGRGEEARFSYAELDERARGLAARLQSEISPGARVILLYPAGVEFVVAFLACLHAGVIAVPAPAPLDGRPAERALERLGTLCASADPEATLTTPAFAEALTNLSTRLGRPIVERDGDRAVAGQLVPWSAARADVAMLQYTSGSTTAPRGVMVTHANLLHNLVALVTASGALQRPRPLADTILVSWLPTFHDMGLAGVLCPLGVGGA